jgi:hypothetical protein
MGLYANGVGHGVYRGGVRMGAYRGGVLVLGGVGVDEPDDPDEPEVFEGFGMVVNSGGDSKFILPLRYGSGTAVHNLQIDWGDGVVDVVTGAAGITAQYQGLTHSFPEANTEYSIKITGSTYLVTAEGISCFGLGFYSGTSGYNALANKMKVKALFGSPEYLLRLSMSSKNYCYRDMFNGCTGLTGLPAGLLPATTLANYCYTYMFTGCTGLTTLPAGLLPATTLAGYC